MSVESSNTATRAFRIDTKNFFITYNDNTMSLQQMVDHWKINWLTRPYDYVCIAREQYPSKPGFHFHVFVQFKKNLDVQRATFFDIPGQTHANIQRAKSDKPASEYVKKDGEYWEDGTIVPFRNAKRKAHEDDQDIWAEILESSNTREEFLDNCKRLRPKETINNYNRLQYFANCHYAKAQEQYVPTFTTDQFNNVPQDCKNWADTYLFNWQGPGRPKSLVIIGDTRLGKTSWARSLGKHTYWNNNTNLKTINPEAQYLVVDDIKFEYFPNWKGWLGCQEEFDQSQKYMAPINIKWGKPCIWCTNYNFATMKVSPEDQKYIEENCVVVYAVSPFY